MKPRYVAGVWIAALSCAACALEVDSGQWVYERAAVVGGEESPPSEDAVVQVKVPFSGYWCSGTLLAPDVVLTALHCVASFEGFWGLYCNSDGTPFLPGEPAGGIEGLLDPEDVEVFFGPEATDAPSAVGRQIFGSGSRTICSDDIALVLLDRELPVQGLPIRVARPVVPGEELTLVGYNFQGDGDADGVWRRSRRRHAPVIAVGPDVASDEPSVAVPRAFLMGEGPCTGDAGGPAISEETGAVVGIFSFAVTGASMDCRGEVPHLYTKVAPFAGLVEEALANAGRTPLLEAGSGVARSTPAEDGCSVAPLFVARRPSPSLFVLLFLASVAARRRVGAREGRR